MAKTLSVVIAAKNCQERIEGTILPWRGVAQEIIVADQLSDDRTAEIAQSLGARVIKNSPLNGNFDLNRKLAMQAAVSDWILYIDTDERPTLELLSEIRAFLQNTDENRVEAVKIPNRFYFLGKELKYGLFDKNAAEIRLVKRDAWQYPCEDGFHRGLSVKGEVVQFKNFYKHFNVNSISEWFVKTNQYTELDAEKFFELNYSKNIKIKKYSIFYDSAKFFFKMYFLKFGFMDGFHGLVSIYYFMNYHLTLKIKYWEKFNQKGLKLDRDWLRPISNKSR